MTPLKPQSDPLPFYAGLVALAGLMGVAGATLLPKSKEAHLAAFVGVGAAVLSGALALPLKRWALHRSVEAVLAALGAVFGVRLVLVLTGVLVTQRGTAGPIPFTLGFFGVYFLLQWIELAYVLAERRRLGDDAR